MSTAGQRVLRERRQYNKWANSQTLEDYALRFTASKARRWSAGTISATALGASSFLACEAIGGAITLAYGFSNAVSAIAAAVVLMFVIGLPIAYYAAKEGLDVDLLTRGAGFGYLGSTITSLIYASFTFLLFAIEASIMSAAITLVSGMPLWLSHIFSALVVLPIALYGMHAITRMQIATQPIWLALQLAPIAFILIYGRDDLTIWKDFPGLSGDGTVDLLLFGFALSTLLSLLPQIGEQADYLRFLPRRHDGNRLRWWAAMLSGGPGWVFVGGLKLLAGSFLALYAIRHGVPAERADSPTDMFFVIFREMAGSPAVALAITGVFVIVCQMKINVTNAYAGSIAWSNFFSRLTHAHPGRVVWLVFNVLLSLLLMELGIFKVINGILILYANLAAAWIGALSADLILSKPLGLSPKRIEFKRAHLYDINPVGVGAMALSIIVSTIALTGLIGRLAQAFAPGLGMAVAFIAAPAIALATHSRWYLARAPDDLPGTDAILTCTICENPFERADMAFCPAYAAPICSLCCTLESRCHDMCKVDSSFAQQTTRLLEHVLPARLAKTVHTTVGHFVAVMLLFTAITAGVLYTIYLHYAAVQPDATAVIATTLWIVFFALLILSGIAAWLMVLAHDSRRAAEREILHQTGMLREEIAAHTRTDAELQKAKEAAEAANAAKTRYLVAVSHEIRSPLNAIYGYAQLLEREGAVQPLDAGRVIKRSSEHLTNLVDGLLEISRIESRVLRLSRDIVPLPAFLDQIVDMFRMQASAKGIELRYRTVGRLPAFVRTDGKRLRQIMINLLSNAVKYTASGHAELTVAYRSQIAEITVADTGVGIRPEDLERIFEPFERGDLPAARAQPGIGLGLAITRVITHIMGGEIVVHSTLGVGTRFVLRLMLPEPMGAPPETARSRRITGYEGARRTILLIDDDPAQHTVVQSLLRPLGFNVFGAPNGREGLALAARCDPDLVLLDIQMPGMTGWEVAAQYRAAFGRRSRVVMVSANAHEFSAGGDGRADHDAFVMKPVDLEVLLDALAEQLGLVWTTEAPPAAGPVEAPVVLPTATGPYRTELQQLARIGHVRGLQTKLDEMAAALPESRSLAERLRARVEAFDFKSFLRILDGRDG